MHYFTACDLLLMHQTLLDKFGGMPGITQAGFGRLETAVGVPQQSMFGEDLYPDLPAKVAALVYAIIRNHPFSDGNKRVGVVALDLMLTIHGVDLDATNDEVYELATAVAQGKPREEVTTWIRQHISASTTF